MAESLSSFRPRFAAVALFVALAVALVVASSACGVEPADGASGGGADRLVEHLDPGWLDSERWDQGDAEINLYDATLVKYGEPREDAKVTHIFVTEAHDPERLVKADDWRRPDLVDMLKMNVVVDVRTGVYEYHQMLSFFFQRRSLHLAKMTLASHEWCGNTFKELVNLRHEGEARSSYSYNTYWDGEGAGAFDVDFPDGLVVYEALPGQLRGLRFAYGLTARFPLLGSQLSSQVDEPTPRDAMLRVVGQEAIDVPAGSFDAWIVELTHGGGTDRLAFEVAAPHRLVLWEQASGDRLALRHSERMAYWQKTSLDDEGLLVPNSTRSTAN